jgi:hypothetical protein
MEGKAEPSKNNGMDKNSAAIDTYVFFCHTLPFGFASVFCIFVCVVLAAENTFHRYLLFFIRGRGICKVNTKPKQTKMTECGREIGVK